MEQLRVSFEHLYREEKGALCFEILLIFIAEHCPFTLVRECYGKLRELLVWGYPFIISRVAKDGLHERYRHVLEQSVSWLKLGDAKGFAHMWKMVLEKEEGWARAYIDNK